MNDSCLRLLEQTPFATTGFAIALGLSLIVTAGEAKSLVLACKLHLLHALLYFASQSHFANQY